jgi:DNA mismatch repair protein MutS
MSLSKLSSLREDLDHLEVFSLDTSLYLDSSAFQILESIRFELSRALCDDPSVVLNEGGIIRNGYDSILDELTTLVTVGQSLLEKYLEEERLKTGISNLKIKYNRLIGYFFEVTYSNLPSVPDYFIRRQSLSNAERLYNAQTIRS